MRGFYLVRLVRSVIRFIPVLRYGILKVPKSPALLTMAGPPCGIRNIMNVSLYHRADS
jgi:hypothetical protein